MKKSILKENEFLDVGEALVSKNGQYSLVYQEDGNLELMDKQKKVLWESRTKNKQAWRTYLEDGQLVVYRFSASPIWTSEVDERGDSLSLEDDGTLVIKKEEKHVKTIYSRVKNLLQSKSAPMLMNLNSSPSSNNYPLDFSLKDMEGNNILPINDEKNNVLILEVSNRGQKSVKLKKLESALAHENNFHFKLDFRSGTFKERTLVLKSNGLINLDTWDFQINKVMSNDNLENIFSIYLLSKNDLEIHTDEKLYFYFEKANASEVQGSRKTRVLFTCNNLEYVEKYTKEKHLSIVYQKGEKILPVNMGFLDTNCVVNNGETQNSFMFHVKSTVEDYPFLLNTKGSNAPVSVFILEFKASDLGNKGEVKNRALAKKDMLNGISVQIQNQQGVIISSDIEKQDSWIIRKKEQSKVPFWEISYSSSGKSVNKNGQFDFNEMVIVVKSIITDEPSGNTDMTLSYKNISGYWDGEFIRQIELTPISIQNQRVGIGTNTPATEFEVKGTIKSTKIADMYGELLPSGSIIMWYGDKETIPLSWKICDGEEGTPDLQDRFIVGAGQQYLRGDQGGKKEVTLTEAEMPKHQHQNLYVKGTGYPSLSRDEKDLKNGSYTIGESQAHENRPPYYALYFIMKK